MGSKKFSALLGLLLASTAGAAVFFQAIPSLVAYYDFEPGNVSGTSVTDASGNGNTGTLQTGAAVSATTPPSVPAGNSQSLQIANAATNPGRMTVPHNASLSITGSLTLAVWVRPTAVTANQMGLIEKWNYTTSISGYLLRLGGVGAGYNYPQFAIGNGTAQYEVAEYNFNTQAANAWIHIAGVYDSGANTITLYRTPIGGPSVVTGPTAVPVGALGASTDPLHLGSDYGSNRLQGYMDEARIFNRALSQPEIGVLVNGMAAPTLTSLSSPEGNQLLLTWTAVAGASSYSVYRSGSPGTAAIPANLVATVTGTSYLDTGVVNPNRYYYVVVANGVMSSGVSNELNEVPMSLQPRYNDHEEGTRDRECACGSAAPGGLFLGLLALFAAALAPRLRRGL